VQPDSAEWVNWLGQIYARAVRVTFAGGLQNIRIFTRPSQNGDPWLTFSLSPAESKSLMNELETSTDVALMTATGNALVNETPLLITRAADKELVESLAFGKWLLSRVGELDPQNQR
jgi:hypothetical protein